MTDQGSATLRLIRLPLANGRMETLVDGGDWDVDGVSVDEETGRLVYSCNVDGRTELTIAELCDPQSLRSLPSPALPSGVAGGVAFDDEAERFAVTVSGRQMNPNLFVVDVGTGAAERWTDASTVGIPRETFPEAEVVRYESLDGLSIPALISRPSEVPQGGAPVIVDVHGGPESQRRPSFAALTSYFVTRGYVVFEPNVRGSTGYGRAYTRLDDVDKRMDAVADLRAGVDWLGEQPDVDTDRVAVMGSSYGGFMVLAAITEYPELWAAGVDVVGIANFVTFLENTGAWRRSIREAEYGRLDTDGEFLESISPITRIDRIRCPLFVIHGANDPRVPVGEAEQIAEAATAQGVPVRTKIFEDEGHGIAKRENRIEAYSAVVDFLDDHV